VRQSKKPVVAIDLFVTMKHNSAFAFFALVGKNNLQMRQPFF
jgi:hypothetical protein